MTPAATALAEAERAAREGKATRMWCALARFVGADLPAPMLGPDGRQPHWIDLIDQDGTMTPAQARDRMVAWLHMAVVAALDAYEAGRAEEPRVRALIVLFRHVAPLEGLLCAPNRRLAA